MKKNVFLMGLVAIALSSCSNEEIIQSQATPDNSIAFRARMKNATRAQDITAENLESFMCYGFKGYIDDLQEGETLTPYFSGVEFTKDESGIFRSATPYYWLNNCLMTFMTYAPADLQNVEVTNLGEIKINNFTVDEDITQQKDIVVCDAAGGRMDSDEVWTRPEVIFTHALTKVFVSGARNSDENQTYKYSVAGVRFGNIAKTGDFIFNKYDRVNDDPEEYIWTTDDNLGNLTYIFDEPVEIGETTTPLMQARNDEGFILDDPSNSFMMIPQQLKYVLKDPAAADDNSNVNDYAMTEGVAYIGLLLRITHNELGDVVYPLMEEVIDDDGNKELINIIPDITEGVAGEQYAWAVFPVGTNWTAGSYVDYLVDFGKGAGYVAPSENEDASLKPILGEISFTVYVWPWNDGTASTVEQPDEVIIDEGFVDDPFADFD